MTKDGKKEKVPENSSMAKNMKEMKVLGKEMDRMKTGKELEQETGKMSDPLQFKVKEQS
ncbi:hypothetical protein [Peribacillus alkalitolerans]|uniref:hypothetical protein n=1 Tax=Peribacillus alkalitolerans TaxID=1550385 RepID=UPI001967288D|nr:hypothetical protein [Peribacillus alkalitolerans]